MALGVSQLFNPCCYSVLSRKELEEVGVPYERNNISDELKEYINERFHINTNDWHLEEQAGDQLGVIDNQNRVVSLIGQ
jgi:hypothetical protein